MRPLEYRGLRAGALGCVVRVGFADRPFDGQPLPLRLDIAPLSPEGFDWGYSGRGPGQLAVALLAHALDDSEGPRRARIVELADQLKWAVIAELPAPAWRVARDAVWEWAHASPRERAMIEARMLGGAGI